MLGPGVRLGDRYRLEERIGAGGMGEVWRAVDDVLSRVVAVKVMLPGVADDPDFARRFQAEATAMARVNHAAVASIHDFGRSHGLTYLVMEFVDGESLAQRLARDGRIAPADTMRLIAQAADGLQAVHDQGIVHRDIKPANLLIRRDGSVLITDFGIARRDDASKLTASGAILGTPSYLSPEQVLGQPATVRSDVYSLGLTAYECLAGQKPFDGDNPYAVALQRLQAAPRTIGITLPAAVLGVLEKALGTDPAHRWPTATALAAAARAAADGSPIPPSPPPKKADQKPRHLTLIAALLAVLVVAGGVAVWGFSRDNSDSATGATGTTGAKSGAGSAAVPAGFTACDKVYCPAAPLCWGGMTAINGHAQPPGRIDCAEPHSYQTYAAIALPAGALDIRTSLLMAQPDIAAACSPELLASRTNAAAGFTPDAWPVQQSDQTWLLHCLARSDKGETTGSIVK
ncbi:serine/threonine-protein kinase [Paractinoplanes durhamensis]|uniref:serine/threonine-protein kinase n=1 Tax=Paractinoplanes durhamensis TaxID=113563 RepID=UPI0019433C49|nr:serine/threonine-protein kinase [Actinoplanes durhamensis]